MKFALETSVDLSNTSTEINFPDYSMRNKSRRDIMMLAKIVRGMMQL